MIKAAIQLAKKDLRIYFRDPVAWLLGFLLPIVLVTIFGFIMGAAWGGGGPAPRVTLYVVDEDQTPQSERFVQQLRDSDMLRVRPRTGDAAIDAAKATQLVADGEASHALVIENGFGLRLSGDQGDRQAAYPLRLVRDPGRTMEEQIVRINLMQAMMVSSEGNWWIGALEQLFAKSGVSQDQVQSFSQAAGAMNAVIGSFGFAPEQRDEEPSAEADVKPAPATDAPTASPEERTANSESQTNADPMSWMMDMVPVQTEDFSPPSRPKQATYQIAQAVAGMAVMMLMFGVTSCSRTLIQERERGTMSRLLSVGVPRGSLLLGAILFTVVIGCLQMIVMLVYGEQMFKVGIFRDPITLVVVALVWIVTASAFGILIATCSRTEKQADMLSTILIISMAALGGCWFPLQMLDLPGPFEAVTRATPTFWAMTGFQGMLWNGADLSNQRMLLGLAVQVGYAAVMGVVAVWFFNRNYLRG